jgi:hypothetical protein
MRRNLFFVLALVLVSVGGAYAQGTQTGVLTGTVASTDRAPLPGVTVTVKSPSLLGTRTTVTDTNGGFIFKGLPAGAYKVTFELAGFSTVEKSVTVAVGSSIPADATMPVATVQETVTVTGEAPTPLTTTQVGANYKSDMIDSLATARTVFGIAQLAPGLSTNTPNAGQVTIAGNFAYDNVFLIDGVDVNDNLFGTANNLFIEDAIEEQQILTSGVSAEYGRFGGGVINTVTKRGSNQFSGSFRVNFTNPSWRDETPREVEQGIERPSALSKFYEGTIGGPIVKDRLWFFAAGRKENSTQQSTLPETSAPFTGTTDENRWEVKLNGAITPNHTVSGTYTNVGRTQLRQTFGFSIEPEHTAITPEFPNDLFVVNYNGVLRSNLFVEAQYSKKYFEFKNFGGTSTDIVDSPYLSFDPFTHYNAPYFDATDPEERNNRQMAASLSYFLSSKSLGKHDIKIGFENYRSTRTGGNSQTATDYVFYTNYLQNADGTPALDANGFVIPVFTPGESQLQLWLAVRGAQIDLTTNSVYLNDRWTLNDHWSFNLGVRAEWADGEATGGIQPVNASRIVPRLGAAYDVRGDGKFKIESTYSHYAGKYSETQFANNTNVGNPDFIYYQYTGPPGQGRNFGPGIDPANYPDVLTGGFPTSNIFYDPDIKSPVTKEWTGAFGMQLGANGYFKTIYNWRKVTDFVQVFVTQNTGSTTVIQDGINFGTFSNQLWANTSDGVREYQGLQFQLGSRINSRWRLDGHWTLQLENDGNQEGEGTNTPGAPSVFSGYYPELFNESRTYPIGRLNDFQRHRVRVWTTYDLSLGKAGSLIMGGLYRFDSGTAYSIVSLARPLTSIQRGIAAALYPDEPGSQDIYYSEGRGSENYESAHLFDLAFTYSVPIYKTVRPWVKFEIRNLFNSTPLILYNTTVTPDNNSPRDALGIPTGYIRGANFGRATSTTHYPFPREYFVALGIRF